jgi:PAS domain S-box-containing protein
MAEPFDYVLEPLREGTDFTLYRGRRRSDRAPVLGVALETQHPSSEGLRRLEHEYSLAADLDPGWAAKPLALTRHEGRSLLVLSDPGGEPLDRVLERNGARPLDMARVLRVAIGLAKALGHAHRQGLIHKDIKPANVLVSDDGDAWLMSFGIATQLPHGRQAPVPPEIIAGTLAYMAPEQTGRMNRSIDSRSDLYSLGVTLYQMLTGRLPFAAADPLEWVHCHIARRPAPPVDLAAVPEALSSITMKLLAKNAEERYQTAFGLEADLRACLAEWELHGHIHEFQLGAHDSPDRLLIPEKLYGREREVETLLAAFDRVLTQGMPEFVLVSGYSGIGKSSVVNELHKALVPSQGLFAAGKFDQYKRDIPYATLAEAFQGLVRQILVKSEAEVDRWRGLLAEAVEPNGQLIVNLIPEVEFILGKQPSVPDLPPRDAQNRFQLVFRRFLCAFATLEHPLALFLDDLQWLDAATLELLEYLVTDPDVRYLLLVGAYRDNEVSSSHPLMRTLSAIRKAGARVEEIVLTPLGFDDVCELVADAVHNDRESAGPLAQLVLEKTSGNPFFTIQFLTALAEEGLLRFDQDAATWSWDLARIRAKGYTDNVVSLMVGKLKRLSSATQTALQQLACLGNVVEFATLAVVYGESDEEIHAALWEAARTGLVLRLDESYRFLHDRVQEAAYALVPAGEQARAHLRIGRALASRTAQDEIEQNIFEIVNQLNRGAALIDGREERERVAELNLIAGKRAKTSMAYVAALKYLATGRELLAEDSWESHYELTFAIEYHRAECELRTTDLAAAEERLTMLTQRARNLIDSATAACLSMTLYTTLDRSDRGVEVCLDYQRHRGVHWSPHPTDDEVRQEYEQIWRQLGERSIEDLVDLPLMNDPEIRAALDVLTEVVTPALFTDKNLLSLAICRMVNLSLEHGNSDGSCFAYVWLGMILGPHFGDYQAGFRFGRLGYDLVEERGLHRYQARAYMSFGNLVMPWTKHIQSGRALVRRAFDAANKSGDLTFAAYCCNNLNTNLLATGDALEEVQREAENGLEFARKARFGLVIDIITAQLGLVRTLRGLTPKFGSFNEDQFDEGRFERHLQSDPRLALPECWYWIRKLQARVFANDYASALDAGSRAQQLLWTSPSFFEVAEYHFYDALAHAAQYDAASNDERPKHLEALASHHRQIEAWAESCPENFANRAALVAAEMARIDDRALDAMDLYEQAIRSAREHGFVQNEGLAHESAARFYLARGFDTVAHAYLRNARNCYDRWGALGKVKHLDQLYPNLRQERISTSPAATIGTAVGQLDLQTVVKASQALSSEIVLPRLIEKLMRIAVEHAGAGRGLLILHRDDKPQIEAEATIRHGAIDVTVQQSAVTSSKLPQSALQYVMRTQERVVLDDASLTNMYSEDDYVRRQRPRSVLCLPIVKQTKLVGALYLENNLTPFAFTSDRVTVLELLAAQAAISLENARLYSDMQRSEAYLVQGQSISHTGSFGWNIARGEIFWSEETYRIFEHDRSAKPGMEWIYGRMHPDDRECVRQSLERAIEAKTGFDIEHRLQMPDGRVKHVRALARALEASPDNLEFVGALTDITDRKRAEEALRRSEAYLGEGQKLSQTGTWACNIATREMIHSSQEHRHLFGLAPDEAGIPPLEEFFRRIHPDDQAATAEGLERAISAGRNVEAHFRIVLPEGGTRYMYGVGHPLIKPSGDTGEYVGAVMDITATKQSEMNLRESEAYLAEAQRLSHTGSWAWNPATDENRYWSDECFRLLGFDPADGMPPRDRFLQRIHPEDRPSVAEELARAARERGEYEVDYRIIHPGGEIRNIHVVGHPVLGPSGDLVELVGTAIDVTERKRAEKERERLRQAQADLAHANRVTTMGELTASVAHEVSQPIAASLTNAKTCLRWLAGDTPNLEEAREAARRIVQDQTRAGEIIRRMRQLFKKAAPQRELVDINEVIREMVGLLRGERARYLISLQTELAANLPQVMGDRVQLLQVLMNLTMNGIDAMADVDGTRELVINSQQGKDGELMVSVSDTGMGLPPERAGQIFDAFFTTKLHGTGMGLRISRSIVESHGGRLWASENFPRGASFHFTLPTAKAQA